MGDQVHHDAPTIDENNHDENHDDKTHGDHEHQGEGEDDDHGTNGYDDEAFARLLATTDWTETTSRLIAYARYRLCHVVSARRSGNFPEDYAQRAITLFVDRTRRFSENGPVSLFSWLCSSIDSLVSHDAEKAVRRAEKGATEVGISTDDSDGDYTGEVKEEHLGDVNFEPELIARDRLQQFAQELEPMLAAYTRLLAEGGKTTAKESAVLLGTTEQVIRNLDRQLIRKRKLYETCWQRQTSREISRPSA